MIDFDKLAADLANATPGPWKYCFESVDPEWAIVMTSGGSVIANVNADHRQDANAALIAAAPDLARLALLVPELREALKACEQEIDGYILQEYPLDHPVHERCRDRDLSANPARAVLAKLNALLEGK